LLFYVRFARTAAKKYYVACFLAYLLALTSKPTSLPLPFVMLLMDYWPLNRLNRKSLLEKQPLFTLFIVFAGITLISQMVAAGVSLPGEGRHSFWNPPLIICYDIIFYPLKILWPANLSSHYPYPQPFGISNPKVLAGIVGTAILIVLLVVSLRRTRAALAGWLIFFVAILPTMQIFRFSDVIASDKFVYLPSLGLLMILASLLLWLYNNSPRRALVISIIVFLLAGAEAVATRRYLTHWSDTLTLYKYMLTLAPNAVPLYGNLANAYGDIGQHEKAAELLEHAATLDPNEDNTYLNLGIAYFKLNRYPEAIDALKRAIRLVPDHTDAYVNLARVYGALGLFEEEIALCKQAIELGADSHDLYIALGGVYGNLGRFGEAVEAYENALKISPKDATTRFGLGLAYLKNGDPNSALRQYEILKQLDPPLADKLHALIQN
jgi:tetratricopeptide (TPR) repeat protein